MRQGEQMTDFLVKLFVKDYKNTDDGQVRENYGIFAGIVGIAANVLLFAAKAVIGLLAGSIAVLADAFNNMTDAVSSIISLVGAKLANRPPDDEHPFGHGRYEYIAAFIVAFLVVQVGFSCAKSAFGKILHPHVLNFNIIAFVILILSVGVKIWLGLFNRKLGKRINSTVMLATAADAMGDVLTTSATIVSLLIFRVFGLNIDGIIGFLVALVVIWAGINIAKDTLKPLLGEAGDPDMVKQIKSLVESYDGILGSHDMIIHNYGPTHSMATLHAEVSNTAGMEETHELIDKIEREVTKKTGVFPVIHMDPIDVDDEHVVKYRRQVNEILKALDEKVSMHDFRMVNGEEQINLIFDVVVPHAYSVRQRDKLMFDIIDQVKAFDERCECVITMENSYV